MVLLVYMFVSHSPIIVIGYLSTSAMLPSVHTTSIPSRSELAVKLMVLLSSELPPITGVMSVTFAVKIPQRTVSPTESEVLLVMLRVISLLGGH